MSKKMCRPNRCRQRHDHEVQGSTHYAEENGERHNHRFSVISGPAIRYNGSHYHVILTRTDFYEDHYHLIKSKSGPAIYVGDGKHVHFIEDITTTNEGHHHDFEAASLIEDPSEDTEEEEDEEEEDEEKEGCYC